MPRAPELEQEVSELRDSVITVADLLGQAGA
jgi:hypothetical protein